MTSNEQRGLDAETTSPLSQMMGLTADQLCRSPLIEWLVPTSEEWNACEVMQDRYDLMKRRIRLAFADAVISNATPEKQP